MWLLFTNMAFGQEVIYSPVTDIEFDALEIDAEIIRPSIEFVNNPQPVVREIRTSWRELCDDTKRAADGSLEPEESTDLIMATGILTNDYLLLGTYDMCIIPPDNGEIRLNQIVVVEGDRGTVVYETPESVYLMTGNCGIEGDFGEHKAGTQSCQEYPDPYPYLVSRYYWNYTVSDGKTVLVPDDVVLNYMNNSTDYIDTYGPSFNVGTKCVFALPEISIGKLIVSSDEEIYIGYNRDFVDSEGNHLFLDFDSDSWLIFLRRVK